MAEKRNVITDGLLYINGTHLLAKVKEFEPPEITQKMAEAEDIGSLGKYKLPILKVDELTSKITLNSFYSEVFQNIVNPMLPLNLSLHYASAQYENQAITGYKTGRIVLRSTVEKFKLFCDMKGQEPSDYPIELNHTMVSHTCGGKELYYIDIPNRIMRIGGVDMLAAVNSALGLT